VLTIVVNFHSYNLQGELKGQKICSCRVFLRKLTCPYEDSASTNQASCLTYLPCFLIFFKSFPQTQESFTYNYLQVFFFQSSKKFFFMVQGFELRTSSLQSRHSTTWTMSPVHFCSGYVGDGGSLNLFAWLALPLDPLILASQVASITGVSHQHLALQSSY
jgi:hypothetical protein